METLIKNQNEQTSKKNTEFLSLRYRGFRALHSLLPLSESSENISIAENYIYFKMFKIWCTFSLNFKYLSQLKLLSQILKTIQLATQRNQKQQRCTRSLFIANKLKVRKTLKKLRQKPPKLD